MKTLIVSLALCYVGHRLVKRYSPVAHAAIVQGARDLYDALVDRLDRMGR